MTKLLLTTAASGHNFLTFEDYETHQLRLAVEWPKCEEFLESGTPVVDLDDGILPSFDRRKVVFSGGFENWPGSYLLIECEFGDQVIEDVANHVSDNDRRAMV